MKALDASILFGVTGLDAFGYDPELDPPCREWREAAQTHTGEGRTIVGAYGPRDAVLSEGSLQRALDFRAGRAVERVAYQ